MAITLGGISLPDLTVLDEFSQVQIRSVVEFSLGGSPLIWEDEFHGKVIILRGTVNTGWITRTILNDLFGLAGVSNATYTLNYEGETKTVRFMNERPPVIRADPIVPRPNHEDGDYYNNVEIRLMELEGGVSSSSSSSSISSSSESSSSESISSSSESSSSDSSSSESSQSSVSSSPSSSSSSESISSSSESSESSSSESSASSESSSSESVIITTTTTTTTTTTI